jgi:hypothetical protein
LSSAILYIAIVAIWAFVLIPRWLRRPHLLGGEDTDHESRRQMRGAAYGPDEESLDEVGDDRQPSAVAGDGPRLAAATTAAPTAARTRVLRSRRRLLIVLITLMVLAAACTYLKLTSWWMCVPPAGMLGLYLLLLREAAVSDAEEAHSRAEAEQRTQAARHHVHHSQHVQPDVPDTTAQVIDISARLGDQLYDQYADATVRAVGD